jgi:uncharacterized protein involved in outer membrane biogenesis
MLKKLAVVFAVFLLVIIGAVAAIPFIVNVDKYRPQLIQAANERLNGNIELGALKLSLWGQIRVDISGLKINDAQGTPVVAVSDAYFHLPFLPILQGSPVLTLRMNQPAVTITKAADGSLNVMKLLKSEPAQPSAGQSGAPAGSAGASPAPGSQNLEVPAIVARAQAGVELRNAQVLYKDATTGLESRVSDFNLVLQDISLTSPTRLEAWADLKTKFGQSLNLQGPFRFEATANPTLVAGRFDGASITAKAIFDEVQIVVPGVFEKKKGVPANLQIAGAFSSREATLTRAIAQFFNAELSGTAQVKNMAEPIVRAQFKSNQIALKPWVEMLPALKGFELEGTASLEGSAEGPSSKLQYQALTKIDGLTAKAPYLKGKPRFDGSISVITDQIENLTLSMKAPGTDVLVRGKVVSFTKPVATFEIAASTLDFDQLLDLPKDDVPTEGKGAAPSVSGAPSGATQTGMSDPASAEANYDAMIEPLRGQPAILASSSKITASVKSMKYYGVTMSDLQAALASQGLSFTLSRFAMKMWDGSLAANAEMNLKPAAPTYAFSAKATGLELKQAVSSQFTLFKNSILGKTNFSIEGSGSSLNPAAAKTNLAAKGNMRVEKATFASIDVGKLTSEALNQSIERIAAKYPALQGKRVGIPPGRESRYEFISSDFTIAGGRFKAPNLVAKAEVNQGVDLRGATEVGIIDYSLKASWQIIDTYNLTKAADLNIDVAGTQIQRALAPANEPVQFPVTVGCKITAPCYTYTEVPEFMAALVLKNASRAAEGRAKAELQQKAEQLIQKAPPSVQKGLDGLKKRLFR